MAESAITSLFMNGRSQAVRLPKAFRMQGDRVRITRDGRKLVIEPVFQSSEEWLAALDKFRHIPFMEEGRNQPPMPPAPSWDD
jgi:antitoxin VapB